jgi:hypothetical protein
MPLNPCQWILTEKTEYFGKRLQKRGYHHTVAQSRLRSLIDPRCLCLSGAGHCSSTLSSSLPSRVRVAGVVADPR